MSKRLLALLTLAFVSLWLPAYVFAHGEPEITVSPDTVAPGGTLIVKGKTMGANEKFTLTLEGLKFQATLGEVESNAAEVFSQEFKVPIEVPEGLYQVRAVGEDGDAVTAELTITGKPATAVTEPAKQPMPSAEEDNVPRRRIPSESIGLFVIAAVSAGLGVTLVWWK